MSKRDVVAVIPTYNMAESLSELLPNVLAQDYKDVYVVDDNSNDHTYDVLRAYRPDVKALHGHANVGAAANRNRLIQHMSGRSALVHFIDADMRLLTDDIPEVASEVMERPGVGFAGGLVSQNGRQLAFNYGPDVSMRSLLTASLQSLTESLHKNHPTFAAGLRKKLSPIIKQRPNPNEEPKAEDAFWVIESNMLIPFPLFEHIGGFDPRLRYHEILDLAYRLGRFGLHGRFDPAIAAEHKALQVRGNKWKRNGEANRAMMRILMNHKLNWLYN